MPLDVEFYSGTRKQYQDEPTKDRGGLYALVDGLGLYRGEQPVAGPCPIDMILIVESTESTDNGKTIRGQVDSTEKLSDIFAFYASNPGSGGRWIRAIIDPELIMMENETHSATELSFVSASLGNNLSSEAASSISVIIRKLIVDSSGNFVLYELNNSVPLSGKIMWTDL